MKKIPFAESEAKMAKKERTSKRLLMTAVVLVAVLLASNFLWVVRVFIG